MVFDNLLDAARYGKKGDRIEVAHGRYNGVILAAGPPMGAYRPLDIRTDAGEKITVFLTRMLGGTERGEAIPEAGTPLWAGN